MVRPLRIQFPDAIYHLTCRGIERRDIFMSAEDRHKFLGLLCKSLETYQVILHSYILMKNHFHLIIQTPKANCSEFMRHFNICYTAWFNYRYGRSGNLYQGRYKAFLIDGGTYLLAVSRYLHLNIVHIKRRQSLTWQERWFIARRYPWSSLAGYVSTRAVVSYVVYDEILSMVGGRQGYCDFIKDGLKRGLVDPFAGMRRDGILGDEQFVAKVKKFLRRGSRREQPAYRDLVASILEPEVVVRVLTKELGINGALLSKRGSNGIIRGIVAELLYRFSNLTQGQIGRMLGGIDYMTVYQLRRRLKEKLLQDEGIRKQYVAAETSLKKLML